MRERISSEPSAFILGTKLANLLHNFVIRDDDVALPAIDLREEDRLSAGREGQTSRQRHGACVVNQARSAGSEIECPQRRRGALIAKRGVDNLLPGEKPRGRGPVLEREDHLS